MPRLAHAARACASVAPLVVATACQLLFPVTDPGSPDAGVDSGVDSNVDGGCSGVHGPTPVRVGAFCIDSTEVTTAQYGDFLDAKGTDTSGQPTECAWNTSYAPPQGWPLPHVEDDYPVGHVDWCDAYAFCQWAGKHLCGKIGGGPLAPSGILDTTLDEWTFACTGGVGRDYPYGPSYEAGRCNDIDAHDADVAPVRSFGGCVGGFPGIFDLSGNAWEWEDACDSAEANANCQIRGGDCTEEPERVSCKVLQTGQRSMTEFDSWGFRCCSN
jgi:formylglycine-generating enzyme required for sulfatase activity